MREDMMGAAHKWGIHFQPNSCCVGNTAFEFLTTERDLHELLPRTVGGCLSRCFLLRQFAQWDADTAPDKGQPVQQQKTQKHKITLADTAAWYQVHSLKKGCAGIPVAFST